MNKFFITSTFIRGLFGVFFFISLRFCFSFYCALFRGAFNSISRGAHMVMHEPWKNISICFNLSIFFFHRVKDALMAFPQRSKNTTQKKRVTIINKEKFSFDGFVIFLFDCFRVTCFIVKKWMVRELCHNRRINLRRLRAAAAAIFASMWEASKQPPQGQ